MRHIKLALTIVACLLTACAPVATNSNPQRKLDSEITRLDSIAITLAEIRALDQGIRDNSSLFFANSRAFNLHTDSLCFSKAIWLIEHYGYIKDLGKYNDSFGYLLEALPAVLLHNPQRLIEPHTYDLLKREVEAGRLSAEFAATLLDKYYVMKEKRTLYFSGFRQWLQQPYPQKRDQALSDSLRQDLGLPVLPDSLFVY